MHDLFVIACPENAEDSSLECCNSFLLLPELMERKIILVRLFECPEDLPAEFCELFKI